MILKNKSILLIVSGGIAAYKSLELVRLFKKSGATVRAVLTKGGEQFITPLSLSSLTGEKTYTELWSLTDETEMGHIRLSREADLIVVAPATANLIGKIAYGLSDDLASTAILASNKPVLVAPAMNWAMWENQAVQENMKTLRSRDIEIIGPTSGDMACGEHGIGRLAEPEDIYKAVLDFFAPKPLEGKTAIVTSGPTIEPIDPVRYLTNHSSGKQGHAVAAALARAGATVTLVSGPVSIPAPKNVKLVRVSTAKEMLHATQNALPADIAVFAAAVSDWRPIQMAGTKIKKTPDGVPPLALEETPDILKTIAAQKTQRPQLVVGFAAETDKVLENALTKYKAKGCDWILVNDVSKGVFGADINTVTLLSNGTQDAWPTLSKQDVGRKLADRIATFFVKKG